MFKTILKRAKNLMRKNLFIQLPKKEVKIMKILTWCNETNYNCVLLNEMIVMTQILDALS